MSRADEEFERLPQALKDRIRALAQHPEMRFYLRAVEEEAAQAPRKPVAARVTARDVLADVTVPKRTAAPPAALPMSPIHVKGSTIDRYLFD